MDQRLRARRPPARAATLTTWADRRAAIHRCKSVSDEESSSKLTYR